MGTDLNDAAQAGVSLSDLIDAANADPDNGLFEANWARLSVAGQNRLTKLLEQVGDAQDKEEATKLITSTMSDDEDMVAIGAAGHLAYRQVAAVMAQLPHAHKGITRTVQKFQRAIDIEAKKVRAQLEEKEHGFRSRLLTQLLRDCPGAEGLKLRCPPGWGCDKQGVIDDEDVRICSPVLLLGEWHDAVTEEIYLDLAWRRRGRWDSKRVPRATLRDSRKLVGLAADGAPVHSANSRKVSQWLAALEDFNEDILPKKVLSPLMGWQPDGGFLVGGHPICTDSVIDEDRNQFAAHYVTGGTWEGWCSVMADIVIDRPRLLAAVLASACTPLLKPLNLEGFAVDWSGDTSLGKTTALRVAASVWGRPSDKDGIIGSWASSSSVGPMTMAWLLQSLPVMLDDTKRQGRHDVITQVVYDIPAGQDRLKGTAEGGVRDLNTWRTCLLSTGEAPITSFQRAGGAAARALCLRGSPMGGEGPEQGAAAEELEARLMQHHGHAGRLLVEWLCLNKDRVGDLKRQHEQLKQELKGSGRVGNRLAGAVALLELTADLLIGLGLPIGPEHVDAVLASLRPELDYAENSSDNPASAYHQLQTWMVSHPDRVWRDQEDRAPTQGWAAFDRPGRDYVSWDPAELELLLERWGYDVHNVIQSWDRKGVLVTSRRKAPKHRMRDPATGARLYWYSVRKNQFIEDEE